VLLHEYNIIFFQSAINKPVGTQYSSTTSKDRTLTKCNTNHTRFIKFEKQKPKTSLNSDSDIYALNCAQANAYPA